MSSAAPAGTIASLIASMRELGERLLTLATLARTAALEEYQAARANLHRRVGSPMFIGGVQLGATALGYLVLRRGKTRTTGPVEPVRPGLWSQVVTTAQVLLPLLMALNSAIAAARRPRASSSGTEK